MARITQPRGARHYAIIVAVRDARSASIFSQAHKPKHSPRTIIAAPHEAPHGIGDSRGVDPDQHSRRRGKCSMKGNGTKGALTCETRPSSLVSAMNFTRSKNVSAIPVRAEYDCVVFVVQQAGDKAHTQIPRALASPHRCGVWLARTCSRTCTERSLECALSSTLQA